MSDIREHVTSDLYSRLLYMAQQSAFEHSKEHKYLPQDGKEFVNFTPHTWVSRAMLRAYLAGQSDGKESIKSNMRQLIGAAKW